MRVCLQELLCAPEVSVDNTEPVLHLFFSVYKSFLLHLEVSVFKSLAAFVHFCLPELCSASVLVCSLQEFCASPGCVCLQESSVGYTWRSTVYKKFFVCFGFFRNRFVCFGCFDTCSKHRNKPKIILWVSRNKPKNNRSRLCFGSNQKYFLFVSRTAYSKIAL
jgi:hypothetical protein